MGRGLERDLGADGRTGGDLKVSGVEVKRSTRFEYPRGTKSKDREDDRSEDEPAHDEPIRTSAGALSPLLSLPLALLLLAPFSTQFGCHA